MKKGLSILIAFLFIITGSSFAQKQNANKEKREAIKAYAKENIYPEVIKERAAFDKKLSTTEMATIQEVRKAVKLNNAEISKIREELKASKIRPSEAQKAQMKEIRQALKTELTKLKPILSAHKEDFKAIKEKMAPLKEKWTADLKEIVEAKHTGNDEARTPRAGNQMLKPMKFILLDPSLTFEQNAEYKITTQKARKGKKHKGMGKHECGRVPTR